MATLHCYASAISGIVLRTTNFKNPEISEQALNFHLPDICTFGVCPPLRSAQSQRSDDKTGHRINYHSDNKLVVFINLGNKTE